MRENRPYGSEGGEGNTFPTPISVGIQVSVSTGTPACYAA
jgi:hypothetical protein